MDKNKNIRKVKESGITLIALVVTIIVLLILAGVTLNIAIDNGGLISRAREAKETYKQAEQNDLAALEKIAEYANDIIEENEMITFYINDKQEILGPYQAPRGTTFAQWINDYHPNRFGTESNRKL